jgi:hypothetical protein
MDCIDKTLKIFIAYEFLFSQWVFTFDSLMKDEDKAGLLPSVAIPGRGWSQSQSPRSL